MNKKLDLEQIQYDAQDYIDSVDQLAQREAELVNDYKNGDFGDFTDSQVYLEGPQNDMQSEIEDLQDDVDGITELELSDDNDSDYIFAQDCLDYCNKKSN